MMAAFASIGLMCFVLWKYGLRDDPPPAAQPASDQPSASAEHHTNDKHQGGMLSPIQVFAHAQVGDWKAYTVTTESSMAQTFTATSIERVSKADDKTVSRMFAGKVEQTGEIRRRAYEDRPRQGLTLDQLTTNDVGGWTLYDVQVTDDLHEIGGRTFKCKKISYASTDPMFADKRTHTDLWISDEVPLDGIVEEIEVQDLPNAHFRITKRVLGFGHDATTTWGERPDIEVAEGR